MRRRLLPPALLALLLPVTSHAAEPSPYDELERFARVLAYVENHYVEPADRKKLVEGAIQGMLGTLDPHTVFLPPEVFRQVRNDAAGEFGGLGLEVARGAGGVVVVAPLDGTPAARAGVRAGDRIVKVDGKPVDGLELSAVLERLRGPVGGQVVLTLDRDGFQAPRDIPLVREHIRIVSVEGALHEGFAHVRVKNFQEHTDQDLARELERLRGENGGRPLAGLVLDLRNNPGGLLDQAVAVADRFLAGGLTIVTTRGRSGQGAVVETSRARDTEPDYPMVVLVNAGSASAAEIVAGALQDHGRALLVGTPTFGKGSVQTLIAMEDGSGLKLTIARYYTPRGRSIQERGIAPDVLVEEPGAPVGPREKDLARHLAAEGPEPTPRAHVDAAPRWAYADHIADLPLRAALERLHALAAPEPTAVVR